MGRLIPYRYDFRGKEMLNVFVCVGTVKNYSPQMDADFR